MLSNYEIIFYEFDRVAVMKKYNKIKKYTYEEYLYHSKLADNDKYVTIMRIQLQIRIANEI